MSELISVIIPVYNVAKYLGTCIDSVLKQSFTNFELILVNDGSIDDSLAICKKYAELDKRIRVINKSNGGAASARNIGLSESRGSYIVFLDGDDIANQFYLEHLYKALVYGDFDIVQCRFSPFTDIDSINFNVISCNEKYPFPVSKDAALNLRLFSVVSWGSIYKSQLFNDNRYYEGIINEDDDIYYRLIYCSKKIGILDEKLYFYRTRIGSVSDGQKRQFNKDFIGIYKRRIGYFMDRNENSFLNGTHFRFAIVLALTFSRCKKNKEERQIKAEIFELFKEEFKAIDFSQKFKKSDVIFLKMFNMFPNLISRIVILTNKC
ncbi:MAG: glycosyltransferase [Bacilli bacterium]|nr:glycosyltransferase [Bacilli bacterium]